MSFLSTAIASKSGGIVNIASHGFGILFGMALGASETISEKLL